MDEATQGGKTVSRIIALVVKTIVHNLYHSGGILYTQGLGRSKAISNGNTLHVHSDGIDKLFRGYLSHSASDIGMAGTNKSNC